MTKLFSQADTVHLKGMFNYIRNLGKQREDLIKRGVDLFERVTNFFPNASDLHFRTDKLVYGRIGRNLQPLIQEGRIDPETIIGVLLALYHSKGGARGNSDKAQLCDEGVFLDRLSENLVADFACEGGDEFTDFISAGRMRIQTFFEVGGIAMVIRNLKEHIPKMEDLNFSKDTIESLQEMTRRRNGICLITGETGAGKSTTLAALMDWVRKNNRIHLLTIEDPIEYVFKDVVHTDEAQTSSLVTQQEIGMHVRSFHQGLRDSLRKGADLIMIGEIRDRATMDAALEAAQTGHTLLATLHTNSASQTIGRILDWYEPSEIGSILGRLSENLLGIVSQGLLPSQCNENKRVLCYEFMRNNTQTSRSAIRKYAENPVMLSEWVSRDGNIPWDRSLEQLYNAGDISHETYIKSRLNQSTED